MSTLFGYPLYSRIAQLLFYQDIASTFFFDTTDLCLQLRALGALVESQDLLLPVRASSVAWHGGKGRPGLIVCTVSILQDTRLDDFT